MTTQSAEGGPENSKGTKLRKILVVDDQCVIADTLVAILKAAGGCSASAAYSGEAALEAIAADVPNLLITDVSMPGMNGVELAVKVRQDHPQCKVLLFSGHSSAAHLIEEARAKGYDFTLLQKPIHPRDLLECLRTAI